MKKKSVIQRITPKYEPTNARSLSLGVLTCGVALLMSTTASATIVFQGGSINVAASWFDTDNGNATGIPANGETATIAVDGTITGGTTNFGSATVNHTAGTLTSGAQNINLNFNGPGGTYNLRFFGEFSAQF